MTYAPIYEILVRIITYLAALWLSPIPFKLVLENCPVEVLQEKLLVAAVVQVPAADASTEREAPTCLLNPHRNTRWNRLPESILQVNHHISLPNLEKSMIRAGSVVMTVSD